jgi:hypothetical protein
VYVLKYGALYLHLDTKKPSAYMFTTLFLLRRFIQAWSTILFGDKLLVINIYFNTLSSLYLIYFYVGYFPFQDLSSNRLELFNEMFNLYSNYSLIVFTDFVPDVELRYKMGFKFVAMVIVVFLVNVGQVFYQLIYQIFQSIKVSRVERRK